MSLIQKAEKRLEEAKAKLKEGRYSDSASASINAAFDAVDHAYIKKFGGIRAAMLPKSGYAKEAGAPAEIISICEKFSFGKVGGTEKDAEEHIKLAEKVVKWAAGK
jgi:HEPN domain-containing protein